MNLSLPLPRCREGSQCMGNARTVKRTAVIARRVVGVNELRVLAGPRIKAVCVVALRSELRRGDAQPAEA